MHCHNDFGLAVANSLAAVRQGRQTGARLRERPRGEGGNAALEEVVLGLMAFYDIRTNVDTKKIGTTSKLVSRMTGIPIPDNKPIVGNQRLRPRVRDTCPWRAQGPIHLRGVQPRAGGHAAHT